MHKILWLTLSILLFTINSYASTTESPPPVGNFALPRSQRPTSFYSFGSNILDPGQLQTRITPNLFKATKQRYIGATPTLLYGTTSNTSLLFTLPFSPSVSTPLGQFTGFGDVGLQGDYQFYQRSSRTDIEQASFLAGFTLPSGNKNLSSGKFSYFFGGTYSHSWEDWLWFAAPGILQYGGDPDFRPALRCYYELGIGRNISSESGQYIFTGFLEINGQYDARNPSPHPITPTSGGSILSDGNLLYLTPSLWLSTQKWAFELGVSLPITQTWFGTQDTVDYYIGTAVIYTFN